MTLDSWSIATLVVAVVLGIAVRQAILRFDLKRRRSKQQPPKTQGR